MPVFVGGTVDRIQDGDLVIAMQGYRGVGAAPLAFSTESTTDNVGNKYVEVLRSYGTWTGFWVWLCYSARGGVTGISWGGRASPAPGKSVVNETTLAVIRGLTGLNWSIASGGKAVSPNPSVTAHLPYPNCLFAALDYSTALLNPPGIANVQPMSGGIIDTTWRQAFSNGLGGGGDSQWMVCALEMTGPPGDYVAQWGGGDQSSEWQAAGVVVGTAVPTPIVQVPDYQPCQSSTPGTPGNPPIAPSFYPDLIIPQGAPQNVNELDGHSSIGQIDAQAIDPTGDLRKIAAIQGLTGSSARLCMGFPGMSLGQFTTLHTMQLVAMDRSPNGLVRFHLADPQRYSVAQVWTTGGPSPWQPGDDTPPPPPGLAFASNGQPISDKNPRYLQGNPIDIYLLCMQNELGVGQDECADPSLWRLYVPGSDSTLLNPNRWIDVPTALKLRDGQFSGVRFEFKITSAQDAKSWLEDQILKPLGLYHRVLANGQLSLKPMKQPVSVTPFALTDDNIIGTPDAERLPIVNVVKVTPGTPDGSSGQVLEFVNAQSVSEFRQQYESDVQAEGFRLAWGGYLLAELLAEKIAARHAFNTPVYSFEAMLKAVKVEVGDFVTITHRLLLDLETGSIGVTNILCEVIDRNPDYASGRVSLKCADTRFMQWHSAFQIAPAGTPDWSTATAEQRAQYVFISNSTGLNSDGSAGNTIF